MNEILSQQIEESVQTACEGCPESSALCLRGIMKAVVSGERVVHNDAVRTLVSAVGHGGPLTGIVSCFVEGCTHSDRIGAHHLIIDAQ